MKHRDSHIMLTYNYRKDLLEAMKILRSNNIKIDDVLSPHPLEGPLDVIPRRTVSIPLVGFWFGLLGGVLGFAFQTWVSLNAYPLQYGGKPFFTPLTYIPVTFELMILFAGISMVTAFLISCRMEKGYAMLPPDAGITDNAYALLIFQDEWNAGEMMQDIAEMVRCTHPAAIKIIRNVLP